MACNVKEEEEQNELCKMWFTGYLHGWNVYSWFQVYCLLICLFTKCNDITSFCARLCLIAFQNLITKCTQCSFTIWELIYQWKFVDLFSFVAIYICKHLSMNLLPHCSVKYGVYYKRSKFEKKTPLIALVMLHVASFFKIFSLYDFV